MAYALGKNEINKITFYKLISDNNELVEKTVKLTQGNANVSDIKPKELENYKELGLVRYSAGGYVPTERACDLAQHYLSHKK